MISSKSSFVGLSNRAGTARHILNSGARRMLWRLACVLLVAASTSFFFSRHASANNVTWDGGGATNNWSEAANWTGDAVPGANDVAIFDGTSVKNATIDAAFAGSVQGIDIRSSYTGTITHSSGTTLMVGEANFSQDGGTFAGGSADIDINGRLIFSGGVFIASSNTTSVNAFNLTGGTFNHNGGTFVLDGANSVDTSVSPTVTLNNFTVDKSGGFFTLGGSFIVNGTLNLNNGQFLFGGPIDAKDAVNVLPTFNGGNGSLTISGPAARTITFVAGTNLPNTTLNATNVTIATSGSGTITFPSLTLQAGTINQGGVDVVVISDYTQSGGTFNGSGNKLTVNTNNFTQTNGTFNGGTGDIDLNGSFALSGGTFTASSGTTFVAGQFADDPPGIFNPNGGTVVLDGSRSFDNRFGAATFNNLTFNKTGGATMFLNSTVVSAGTLTLADGFTSNGTLEARGAVVVGPGFDGGNALLTFAGAANQTFTNNGGANPSGTWTVNKPSGQLTLASDLILDGNQQLNINSGTLDMSPSFNLQTSNTLSVAAAGILRDFGTGDLTLGGDLSNAGLVNLNGGGTACSDPNLSDPLQVHSTNTTQRTWSGTGTFSLVDVDVDTQSVGATPGTITAFGTSHLNNTNGFVLNSGCPVTINGQPGNQAVCLGGSATFSVTTTPATGVTFQWRKGGTPLSNGGHISGADTSTLNVSPVGASDAGSYDVVVANSLGITATSNPATLSINDPPAITQDPVSATLCQGLPVTFTAAASGTGPLSFQWRKDGTPIPGANSSSFSIGSVVPADEGSYDVVVNGACGPPAVSQAATLTVNTPPAISSQPSNQSTCLGGSASFSVSATGTNLTFQWRKNGVNLLDGNQISGAHTATLTINPVSTSDADTYDVVIGGTCNPPLTSNPATFTVNTPDLSIDKSHNGNFTAGIDGTYTLTVTNAGTCTTTGTITVTDPLPAGLSFVSATGTGWSCSAAGQNVTCTNTGPLAPSATSAITLTVGVSAATAPGVTNTATVATQDDNNAANNSDSDPTTVVNNSAPTINPGDLIISEFRLRGPDGANDEFVELYNNTNSDITVGSTDASSGFALFAPDGVAHYIIPNGTVIPARGHLLCANSNGYSLAAEAAADIDAQGNNLATSDGLALFSTSASPDPAKRLDAVGFTTAPALFREGAGLPVGHTGTASAQYAYVRRLTTGLPQDTGDNASDFALVSVSGDLNGTPVELGAPGPENLASPIQRNAQIKASLIDPLCSGTSADPATACARVRVSTSDPANNSTFGTLSIRRTFKNNSGAPITRLRFRVVDITTLNSPSTGGAADVRPLGSVAATVTRADGATVPLSGLTLEEPPTQTLGGGLNSALAAGGITTLAPLAPGATINVEFKLGVQATGSFRFFINIEAATGASGPQPAGKSAPRLKRATSGSTKPPRL